MYEASTVWMYGIQLKLRGYPVAVSPEYGLTINALTIPI